MVCPRCQAPLQAHLVQGHNGRQVEIDLCLSCQALWFDGRESLQLSPGGTLTLFSLMGEHAARPMLSDGDAARCPRCQARLRRTSDMQRATRFQYFKCPHDHGRFISFFDFLKEKDFIRPLTPVQADELRQHLQTVRCSGCGATVDLARGLSCAHCGSALSMLDLGHAERLVQQLREASRTDKPIDPALPMNLARARRDAEAAFRNPRDTEWYEYASAEGLVAAGLQVVARGVTHLLGSLWQTRRHG